MAYTAGFSVNVGDPTKASDVTPLAANDDFLKAAVDAIMADSATPSSTLKAAVVLADGVTATTQSAGNNTTRVATTAFVKTAVDASSTDPGGSNTQIQYNNSGAFGGSANLTFDGTNLTVAGELDAATLDISGDADIDGTLETDALTIGGTALLANDSNNRVTTATGSGTLNGEANLTFDGTTLVNTGQGIGVGEAPSTWASGFDFVQIGGTLALASQPGVQASQSAYIVQNAHYDSDNSWEYQATDEAHLSLIHI